MKIHICSPSNWADSGACILALYHDDGSVYLWRHKEPISINKKNILGKKVKEFLGYDYYDFKEEIEKLRL